jgi:hypothetical protein
VYVVTLSPENVEADRSQIRTRLAAEKKIAKLRKRAASPRIYMDDSVPGGRSENITPPSQG